MHGYNKLIVYAIALSVAFFIVVFESVASQLDKETRRAVENIIDERVQYVEDDIELYRRTEAQSMITAFDSSHIVGKMFDQLTSMSRIMSRNEGSFKSLVDMVKEDHESTANNADNIVGLGSRVTSLELFNPVIARRVEKIENNRAIKIERNWDFLMNTVSGILVTAIPATILWWFGAFCKRRRFLSRIRAKFFGGKSSNDE